MSQILLLEDDAPLGAALQRVLQQAGFTVQWRRYAAQAGEDLRHGGIAAAILDVQLPDGDGFEVLRRLRQDDNPVPVLMLTVRDRLTDRVRGLDEGADDYVLKPAAPAELIARVRGVGYLLES